MQQDQSTAEISSDGAGPGEDRYLVFAIGDQSFAAPLLSIREIVEPLAYCVVPSHDDYFLGLANLRGQIVGVLDLGRRFDLPPVAGSEGVFLVFDVGGTSMAGLVHRVEAVMVIPAVAIDHNCQAAMTIPATAFGGIAKSSAKLLPVVNLQGLVAPPGEATAA